MRLNPGRKRYIKGCKKVLLPRTRRSDKKAETPKNFTLRLFIKIRAKIPKIKGRIPT